MSMYSKEYSISVTILSILMTIKICSLVALCTRHPDFNIHGDEEHHIFELISSSPKKRNEIGKSK